MSSMVLGVHGVILRHTVYTHPPHECSIITNQRQLGRGSVVGTQPTDKCIFLISLQNTNCQPVF